jgi:hypothetical protein
MTSNKNELSADLSVLEPGVPQLGLSMVETPSEPTKTLDLCVIVDDTGSMGDMLAAVKTILCDAIREYQNHPAYFGWTIKFSVIAYNDWNKALYIKNSYTGTVETSPTLTWHPFTENVEAVKNKIMGLIAHGGHDVPEDVAGALKLASLLEWTGTVKVLLFATDAPGHGFTNGADNFPNGDPIGYTKASTLATVELLANMGIDFTFIDVSSESTKAMRLEFKKVYEDTMAENPTAGTFKTQDVVCVQPEDLDRSGMVVPLEAATPSADALMFALRSATTESIYRRTGLTPMADYEAPSMPMSASVASCEKTDGPKKHSTSESLDTVKEDLDDE